jgi:hypothetical protein
MLTEEHSDWNDRIGELIRETINRAGELRDLLTMSRFLAQHEVGPLDPNFFGRLKENQYKRLLHTCTVYCQSAKASP